MSLLNQMLQDLEKRRASGTERGELPDQVRVLPRADSRGTGRWLAGVALAVVVIAGIAWQVNQYQTKRSALAGPGVQTEQSKQVDAATDAAPGSGSPASRMALDLNTAAGPGSPRDDATMVRKPAPAKNATAAKDKELSPPVATSAVVDRAPALTRQAARGDSESQPAKSASSAASSRTPVAPDAKTFAALNPAPQMSSAKPANVAPEPATSSTARPPTAATSASAENAKAASAVPVVAAKTASPDTVADNKARVALANPQIDKRSQQLSPQSMAENEYREAANLLNQGRLAEAQEGFRLALQTNPAHVGARQGLFGLLIEAKKNGEAEQVLLEGLRINPNQAGFAMALARMQVDRGDAAGAIETLQKPIASGQSSPDYLAFLAALYQRTSQHKEAVDQYQAALRLAPQSGIWLMGLGISLQALKRNSEAQEAFRRARSTNTLNPELTAFVDQRLKQLQ